MKLGRSLDIRDGNASPSGDEGAELLNPSGGVEKEANCKILLVSGEKLAGSTDGSKP